MTFNWTKAKEEELIELWKTMPAMFDPGCRNYSNRTEKDNALREIAETLGTTMKEVDTRMRSIRTQYGRLGKLEPSGSGTRDVTPKQAWLQKNCSFLSPHLKKRSSQSNLNLSNDLNGSQDHISQDTAEMQETQNKESAPDDTELDTDHETSVEFDQVCSKTSNNIPTESKKRKSNKRKFEDTELELLNTMTNAMVSFQQRKPAKEEDDVDVFVKGIGNKLRKIQDPRIRAMAEFEIESICYKANMGMLNMPPQNVNSPGIYISPSSQQGWSPSYDNSAVIGDQGRTYAQL